MLQEIRVDHDHILFRFVRSTWLRTSKTRKKLDNQVRRPLELRDQVSGKNYMRRLFRDSSRGQFDIKQLISQQTFSISVKKFVHPLKSADLCFEFSISVLQQVKLLPWFLIGRKKGYLLVNIKHLVLLPQAILYFFNVNEFEQGDKGQKGPTGNPGRPGRKVR